MTMCALNLRHQGVRGPCFPKPATSKFPNLPGKHLRLQFLYAPHGNPHHPDEAIA